MRKIGAAPAVTAAAFVISLCALAQDIHFKTRTFSPASPGSSQPATNARAKPEVSPGRSRGDPVPLHRIVEFDHPPGVDDLNALLVAGAQVTGALPDNSVVVSTTADLGGVPGAIWTGPMDAQDKISPALGINTVMRRDPGAVIPVIVEFHSDVDAAQQNALGISLNQIFLRPSGLLPKHVIAQATRADIELLAAQDEVAYIFPADPALLTGASTYPCAGMLTTAGTVAQYANITHGWTVGSDNFAHLNYYFSSLTPQVPAATVESEILRAFATWASQVNVTFSPAAAATLAQTIAVEFVSGAHGDSYPFTAPSLLAHTFYPVPVNSEPIAGDMHLNADENWQVGADIDIYTVALHEAGHALGLSHSDNPGDVMYPYYQRGVQLSANDIGAVQELYPAAGTTATPVTATSAPVTTASAGTSTASATPTAGTAATGTPATGTTVASPSPLALTVAAVPATTQSAAITVAGSVSGGSQPDSVEWQTDHGYTGNASVAATGAWTASGIPLVTGANTLTLTAFNSADQSATQAVNVTLLAPSPVAASPLSIAIVSPVTAVTTVTAATLCVSGKASGGAGVTAVTWLTSNGATGTASGTDTWVAAGIPIPEGNTTIIVRAYDSTGASNWVATVVVRP